MRKYSLFSVLLIVTLFVLGTEQAWSATETQATVPVPPANVGTVDSTWTLLFQDEFEGDSLDESKWVRCYWWNHDGCNIPSNDELEWYQPQNVLVEDGALKLQARKEKVVTTDGKHYDYSSGMVTTGRIVDDQSIDPKFVFQYGYVEMRARVPKGQGLWPAFWMLPAYHRSRPHINIVEVLGQETNRAHMHFHYLDDDNVKQQQGDSIVGPDLAEGWHTFGVLWRPGTLRWYIDGVQQQEIVDAKIVPNTPLYLVLNLAVGGWAHAPADSTPFPSNYEIDYVRVWSDYAPTGLCANASTYVSASTPNQNFGESINLVASGDPSTISYLRFDTTALKGQAIDSATLRVLTNDDIDAGSQYTQTIHLVEDKAWDESTTTYKTRPKISPEELGTLRFTEDREIYDIKLNVDLLRPNIGQVLSLALLSSGDDNLEIYSSRHEACSVRLTFTSGPPHAEAMTFLLPLLRR